MGDGRTRFADELTLAYIKRLEDALRKIRDINTADCAKYVEIADSIACEALTEAEKG